MFAKEATAGARDNMVNEGGHTANDAEAVLQRGKKTAQEAAHAIKEDIEEMAHRAGCHARDLADSAGHNLEDLGDVLISKVRKKPLQSVAAAIGIGVIFGILYRR